MDSRKGGGGQPLQHKYSLGFRWGHRLVTIISGVHNAPAPSLLDLLHSTAQDGTVTMLDWMLEHAVRRGWLPWTTFFLK